jgi:hypothetical protein
LLNIWKYFRLGGEVESLRVSGMGGLHYFVIVQLK